MLYIIPIFDVSSSWLVGGLRGIAPPFFQPAVEFNPRCVFFSKIVEFTCPFFRNSEHFAILDPHFS